MIQKVAGFLAGLVAWLLSRTYRITEIGHDHRLAAHAMSPGGVCFAILHEHQLHAITTNPEPGMVTIASRSKDGDIIATALRIFRVRPARGSSSRGGKEALQTLREWVSAGATCTVTVDGPRGPRRQAKPGIVRLAQTTGRPLVPAVAVASHVWRFRSWDRFEIAKPFSRIVQIFGAPIAVDGVDPLLVCEQLSRALAALDKEGRRIAGRAEDWQSEG